MFASVIAGAAGAIADESVGVIAPAALSVVVVFSCAHAAIAIAPPTRATRVKRLLSMFLSPPADPGLVGPARQKGARSVRGAALRFAGLSEYLLLHDA